MKSTSRSRKKAANSKATRSTARSASKSGNKSKTEVRAPKPDAASSAAAEAKAKAAGAKPKADDGAPRRKSPSRSKKRIGSKTELTPAELTPDKDGYVVFKGRRVRMISTKNLAPRKKSKKSRFAGADANEPRFIDQPVKTRLSKRDLDRFRNLLLTERSRLMGDLKAMEVQALQVSGGNLSAMPIHMADIGSDVYDQDFMLGMAESERRLIREIDAALQRIEDKTYGMCLLTGKPIPKARLNAKPWAKYTIEAARMVEDGRIG